MNVRTSERCPLTMSNMLRKQRYFAKTKNARNRYDKIMDKFLDECVDFENADAITMTSGSNAYLQATYDNTTLRRTPIENEL